MTPPARMGRKPGKLTIVSVSTFMCGQAGVRTIKRRGMEIRTTIQQCHELPLYKLRLNGYTDNMLPRAKENQTQDPKNYQLQQISPNKAKDQKMCIQNAMRLWESAH